MAIGPGVAGGAKRFGFGCGIMLGPEKNERIVLKRNKWYCLEQMIQANNPGKADVHQARKDNTVWYDDVAISTGYLGPTAE